MTAAPPALRRAYAMHGVTLEVRAEDSDVIDAMDLRLRAFPPQDAGGAAIRCRFGFEVGERPPPAGTGRPVYETPYGALHYHPELDTLAGSLGGVALRCEPGTGQALISAPRFAGRALYFATHPLATIALMELMERHGRFSLHAACLAAPGGRGVLLSGPSGAGKSTLALALARSGMGILGDDIVFLRRPASGPGAIAALGFADTLGVGSFAAERFPELRRLAAGPPADGFPKRLHRIEDVFARAPLTSCVPRALVFPEVRAGRPSALAPLAAGEALVRLAPDVLLTEPRATQAHLAAIGDMLAQVSCYTLRSGADIERAAQLVAELV